MKRTRKATMVLFFTFFLSVGFSSIASASCTDWETYEIGTSYCTTEWCNPINPWSGEEEMAFEKQSRVCNVGGPKYEVEERTVLKRQSCDC